MQTVLILICKVRAQKIISKTDENCFSWGSNAPKCYLTNDSINNKLIAWLGTAIEFDNLRLELSLSVSQFHFKAQAPCALSLIVKTSASDIGMLANSTYDALSFKHMKCDGILLSKIIQSIVRRALLPLCASEKRSFFSFLSYFEEIAFLSTAHFLIFVVQVWHVRVWVQHFSENGDCNNIDLSCGLFYHILCTLVF